MKLLKLFLAGSCVLSAALTVRAQQPENDSQVQADQIRKSSSTQPAASLRPPVHILHLNSQKETIADVLQVLPGQKVEIGNDAFAWIRIFSDYPFSIVVGSGSPCRAPATKDITCEIMPSLTIHLQDLRTGVPAYTGPINHVHITALKHAP